MCGEKKSESGVKRAKWPAVRTAVSQYPSPLEIDQTINELRVACEVWSTEVCEVSLTKNLRGKPAREGWEKSRKSLGYLCSRGKSVFIVLKRR